MHKVLNRVSKSRRRPLRWSATGCFSWYVAPNSCSRSTFRPWARIIGSTVEMLVRDIAGNALVDADLLAKQVDDVLAMAAAQTDRKILRLHPDDVVLLSNIEIAAEVRADPSIAAGSMCLDLDDGVIEHGRAPMLEALDVVLQRVDPAS